MSTIVNAKTGQSLKDAIIDLYLNVKIRSSEEITNFSPETYEQEKLRLNDTNLFVVLDYIRSTVEILMTLRADEGKAESKAESNSERSERSMPDPPKEYEQQLQKLEAEVRAHIRVEQQLKLHIETIQFKLEDLERAKQEQTEVIQNQQAKMANFKATINKKSKEVTTLVETCQALKEQCESLKKKQKQLLDLWRKQGALHESVDHPRQSMELSEDVIPKSCPQPQPQPHEQNIHEKRARTRSPHHSSTSPKLQFSQVIRNIHVPRGVGIKEQNIYQIICKTPGMGLDHNPYILDICGDKPSDQGGEISKLKQRLNELQNEIKAKKKPSRDHSTESKQQPQSPVSSNSSHIRTKSQKSAVRARRDDRYLTMSPIPMQSEARNHRHNEMRAYIKSELARKKAGSCTTNTSVDQVLPNDYSQVASWAQMSGHKGPRTVSAGTGTGTCPAKQPDLHMGSVATHKLATIIGAKLEALQVKDPKKKQRT